MRSPARFMLAVGTAIQHELAMYAQTFSELAELAVYGAAARELITGAIESLG
ncbi:hypothetical protein ACIRD9_33740 [Streptomyces violaceus]|uniref:hypothetical protein n=1 Tax=Streptomyces violaceus TaxID=1936 RepID=UPI00380471C7